MRVPTSDIFESARALKIKQMNKVAALTARCRYVHRLYIWLKYTNY